MAIDWIISNFATCESTQITMHEVVKAGQGVHGTVIQAMTQEKGYGRHGRQWDSPMGNLYMSVLLKPDCTTDALGQLSFVVALAVSDAIEIALKGHDFQMALKWPNDVLLNEKKCAGILIETDLGNDGSINAAMIGIGVNILAPPEGRGAIKDSVPAGTQPIAIHPFRDLVLTALDIRYAEWQDNGFEKIRKDWSAQAYKLGETIEIIRDDAEYKGRFEGIDDKGQMILKTGDGKSATIHSGVMSDAAYY